VLAKRFFTISIAQSNLKEKSLRDLFNLNYPHYGACTLDGKAGRGEQVRTAKLVYNVHHGGNRLYLHG
jgi:hypothetical protein